MPIVKINNMLKFYILCLLSSGPKHGYDLIKELESKMGRKISASHVYTFLSSLMKNKLVNFDKVGSRDKKVYHLTAKGLNFTKDLFNKFGDLVEMAISPKITACPCGCKVYSGGHAEKVSGKIVKFCCAQCSKAFSQR